MCNEGDTNCNKNAQISQKDGEPNCKLKYLFRKHYRYHFYEMLNITSCKPLTITAQHTIPQIGAMIRRITYTSAAKYQHGQTSRAVHISSKCLWWHQFTETVA